MNTDPGNGTDCCYLTDISERDKPWDAHRSSADRVKDLYQDSEFERYSQRMSLCSGLLDFGWATDLETGELRLKLKSARFCRVRHCPVCQWRRTLMWVARFLKALPAIQADYPTARYVFLTLTVRNPEITELRTTITHMQESWKRLSHRKQFPALGFARALEVTRSKDGTAHPHFHALLMVPAGYFHGKGYLTQAQWKQLWKEALRVEYDPSVHVRAVRPNKKRASMIEGAGGDQAAVNGSALAGAIVEVFKYTVKEEDLIGKGTDADRQWLEELTRQLHNSRAIALGGVFKKYMSESDPEDLIGEDVSAELVEELSLRFGWRENVQRYAKVQ